MNNELNNKKSNLLIFLCWLAYTAAYVARLNYNASMVEVLSQLNISKETAGTVSSFFFFAYGAGQLINGILCKKYNTKYSVFLSLTASSVINLLMTFCDGADTMKYLWFFNGIFQSVLWSSIIKTLSQYLTDKKLSTAVMAMSTTVAGGTFTAYGLAALFSALQMSWKLIFYISSAVAITAAIAWFTGLSSIQKCATKIQSENTTTTKNSLKLTPAFIIFITVIAISAISNGFIKDGVTTWVPSILKEEFNVSPSLSIIVTLLLPVLSVFGATIVKQFHKKIKNENILNGIFYTVTTILTALIILTIRLKSPVVTLGLFGLTACMMSAVNNVITSIVPLYSRDKIDSGLAAGVLNTFCYVGSTLSIPLLGSIADSNGWNSVFICLLIFAAVSAFACTVTSKVKKI